MAKYRQLFSQYCRELLSYRLRLFLLVLSLFISPLIMVFIFSGIKNTTALGMSKESILGYFVYTGLLYLFFNSRVDDFVKLHIQEGTFANFTIKPISFWVVAMTQDLANRLVKLAFGLPIFLVLFLILPGITMPSNPPLFMVITAVAISYCLAFIISFDLGLATFFIEEIWGFQNLKHVLFIFLGGAILPYQIFPTGVMKILYWTPLPYIINWPIRSDFVSGFPWQMPIAVFWLSIFTIIGVIFWKKGLKSYSAMGAG